MGRDKRKHRDSIRAYNARVRDAKSRIAVWMNESDVPEDVRHDLEVLVGVRKAKYTAVNRIVDALNKYGSVSESALFDNSTIVDMFGDKAVEVLSDLCRKEIVFDDETRQFRVV